jgi:GNAT superfamily N-acetyltransferase
MGSNMNDDKKLSDLDISALIQEMREERDNQILGNLGMTPKITIREMTAADPSQIARAFSDQGWDKPESQFIRYVQEEQAGQRVNLLAEVDGHFAGYVTVVWASDYPPFLAAGIPEIVDFNVLIKYRRQGIGTTLMDAAEEVAGQRSPLVGLGVCLHVDYGAAQVLYVKRGYVPDGRGVYYQGRYPGYGDRVEIGDDLTLYLTKRLRDRE